MANRLSLDYFHPGQTVMLEKWMGKRQSKGISKIIGAKEPFYLLVDMPFVNSRALFSHGDKQCVVRFISEGAVIGFRARIERILLVPFPILVLLYPEEFEEIIVRESDRVGCNIPARLTPHASPPAAGAKWQELENKTEGAQPNGATSGETSPEQANLSHLAEPLQAAIIDLSVGGCQASLPCIDPDNPLGETADATPEIPAERRADYHPLVLKGVCARGKKVGLEFALPSDEKSPPGKVECRVCWTKVFRNHYLVGLKFLDLTKDLNERVRKTVEVQKTFFTQPFEPF